MRDPLELLLTRRSVGRVRADPVAREVVEQVLTAAVCAPNHGLTRPWRFIVLSGAARRAVGEAHAAAVARERPEAAADVLAREAARLERAPVVVVCVVATDPASAVTAREDRDAVAAGVQNLLLAAHARGLAAMWRTGTMVDEPEVRAALRLGPGDDIVAFVYLGYEEAPAPHRERGSLEGLVEWREE